MKIEILKNITVKDIAKDFMDGGEEGGVVGYGGKLNIRPKYQREWVYDDAKREKVIRSIENNYPINVMYWVKTSNNNYEVLDGQQRILSFCKYVAEEPSFSLPDPNADNKPKYFYNRDKEYKNKILNYNRFTIYICEGTDEEIIKWFKIVNIAGEPLKKQEIRNAVYCGSWVSDAKIYFSKTNGPAHRIAKDYIAGSANRQDYLENAIKWYCENSKDNLSIEDYMRDNQNNESAKPLWNWFSKVIDWINITFPKEDYKQYKKYMKGVNWGVLYKKYSNKNISPSEIKNRIDKLLIDHLDGSLKNIFEYGLSGDSKLFRLRAFSERDKLWRYNKVGKKCEDCGQKIEFKNSEADHIKPFSKGGDTTRDNLQILCKDCNARKGNKY